MSTPTSRLLCWQARCTCTRPFSPFRFLKECPNRRPFRPCRQLQGYPSISSPLLSDEEEGSKDGGREGQVQFGGKLAVKPHQKLEDRGDPSGTGTVQVLPSWTVGFESTRWIAAREKVKHETGQNYSDLMKEIG